MSLKDLKVLLVDAQTTGIRPPAAQLLELGWCATEAEGEIVSRLVALREGASIPRRVSTYDRMSILLAEMDRTGLRIEEDL
jgi:hypothetical protein